MISVTSFLSVDIEKRPGKCNYRLLHGNNYGGELTVLTFGLFSYYSDISVFRTVSNYFANHPGNRVARIDNASEEQKTKLANAKSAAAKINNR